MASNDYRSTSEVFQVFLKMLRLDRSDISAIYLFAVLAGLVQLSLPLGIQTIVGFVMAGSISTSIVILIIMVVGGTFLNGMLQVRQLQLIEKLKQKIFVRYALTFSSRFPKLNIERLDNYHLPEMVNRFFEIPIGHHAPRAGEECVWVSRNSVVAATFRLRRRANGQARSFVLNRSLKAAATISPDATQS